MNKILIILLVLLCTSNIDGKDKVKIKLYYVNYDKGEVQPLKEYKYFKADAEVKSNSKIIVMPEFTFQTIEGIGGAFNEIGGEALLSLNKDKQKEVLKNLFGDSGSSFTFCRTAIGASDFGINAYSYSDVAEDFKMKHFSVDHDKKYVLPYLQGAVGVNPDLKIFASPWSPPAWMKKSGKMDGVDYKKSTLRKEKKVYKAYAKFFAEYAKAYKENGVDISRICIQNEPDISTKYPSCVMSAQEMHHFAKKYMVPYFKKNKIRTEIYAGTFRADNMDMHKFLELDGIKVVDGFGVQYSRPHLISQAKVKYPRINIMHTEGGCFDGKNTSSQAESRFKELIDYVGSGCTNFCYWNMILNETGKSGWDWKQNSLINIDRESGEITYNPDYNIMYIISKFIRPGDVRVASFNNRTDVISFKDAKGNIKLFVQNKSNKKEIFTLSVADKNIKVYIPKKSVSVLVIDN